MRNRVFSLLLVVLLVVTAFPLTSRAQTGGTPDLVIPDNGIGFSLTLPPDTVVELPGELQPITLVTVSTLTSQAGTAAPIKVEIYAERMPAALSFEDWRAIQDILTAGDETQVVSTAPTAVAGQTGTFREISSPYGTIGETEVVVNHVVYRISSLQNPDTEELYKAVLSGIQFTGSDSLPVNDLPPLAEILGSTAGKGGQVESLPNLKFPFNGTHQITCAYYPDDHACHADSIYALDFNLYYEAVRTALSGTLYRYSESCGGIMARVTSSSDSRYIAYYGHLASYMGASGYVGQGDYIARSGNSGSCTSGAHLHFRLAYNGVSVKPEPMCGQTGFKRYQYKTDCWPSSEEFATGAYSQISISVQSVNLKVCASNLPGKTVWVSMWRGPAGGGGARSWLYSKVATSTCVQFYDLDGPGNTFAGVYYYTNAALRAIPPDLASQQKASCYTDSGHHLMCDRAKR